MRKVLEEIKSGTIEFNVSALERLQREGYKFVQVKGLTNDYHYDYIDPQFLVLIPLKELPIDPFQKDIYEPVNSELLYKWATEINNYPQIVIANDLSI